MNKIETFKKEDSLIKLQQMETKKDWFENQMDIVAVLFLMLFTYDMLIIVVAESVTAKVLSGMLGGFALIMAFNTRESIKESKLRKVVLDLVIRENRKYTKLESEHKVLLNILFELANIKNKKKRGKK